MRPELKKRYDEKDGPSEEWHQLSEIKILIADDHAVVREGTRQILEQEPDLT